MLSLCCKALCIVINFSVFGSSVWVSRLTISKVVQNILLGGLPRCLFLWWDFYGRILVSGSLFVCLFVFLLTYSFFLFFLFLFDAVRFSYPQVFVYPVDLGGRINRLNLCWGVTPPPTGVQYLTLNNLLVKFQ